MITGSESKVLQVNLTSNALNNTDSTASINDISFSSNRSQIEESDTIPTNLTNLTALFRKASTLQDQDRYDEALEYYDIALAIAVTLSDDPEGIKRNLFIERPDVPAGHRMISFSYRGQAWHPNFDT